MKNISIEKLHESFMSARDFRTYEALVASTRLKAGVNTVRLGATRHFKNYSKDRKMVDDHFEKLGYIMNINVHEMTGVLMSEDETYLVVAVNLSYSTGGTMAFSAIGDEAIVAEHLDWFKAQFSTEGSVISTATHLKDNGIVNKDQTFVVAEEATLARQEFYPWLSISLEEYYKAFMDSKESVLVLFGPPGTGKSTLVRSLIIQSRINAMVAFNKEVIESPALIRTFLKSSSEVLVYEDIDRHLTRREDGNTLMASLLNAADGVVENTKKIIFVTNLPSIDRIDPALLREGRCFDILKFDLLSLEEAQLARAAAGMELREFAPSVARMSLADALANKPAAQQVINRFGRKPGFA